MFEDAVGDDCVEVIIGKGELFAGVGGDLLIDRFGFGLLNTALMDVDADADRLRREDRIGKEAVAAAEV